jgi:hypothetical protein
MSRLQDQHRRLYGPSEGTEAPDRVRGLVIGLARPADWNALSAVWQGVQADLDLPAPGIVVNGVDGIELWFSLAEPQAAETLAAFGAALAQRYLPGLKPGRLRLWPHSAIPDSPPPLAPHQTGPERWAAFVAPDLAAVFADDPALDMPPGDDAQAELLSRLSSVSASVFHAAQAQLLQAAPAPSHAGAQPQRLPGSGTSSGVQPDLYASLDGPFQDPRAFLLAVMNNRAVPLAQRMEAARALLPQGPVVQG